MKKFYLTTQFKKKNILRDAPELQPRLYAHICYTLTINHNYEHLDELISLKFVYKTKVKEKYLHKKKIKKN